MIKRDNKDFILYAGLLDLLHQESEGRFTIHTHLEQAPAEANGQTAIVSAVVNLGCGEPGGRTASGLGDANPGNVSRAMAPHTIRMAETRAKARALRDLLNVGLVAAEELGPSGPAPAQGQGPPQPQRNGQQRQQEPEGIVVQGQQFSRTQVWSAYTQRMEQMKAAGLAVPAGMVFTQASPLSQLVGATQNMRRQLEAAHGGEPPAPERSN